MKTAGRFGAVAALALATASPAYAQHSDPIRVGVIDTDASEIQNEAKGITVAKMSFLGPDAVEGSHRTGTYREHGAEVMSAFIEQSHAIDPSRPIAIYSAVAFYRSGDRQIDEQKNRPMKIDIVAATKSLDWFKSNDVRIVVTAFITPDNEGMQKFMGHARELGLIVFAATNNQKSTFEPFPARHPDAISVTGNSRDLDFTMNPEMHKWVRFQAPDGIPGRSLTITPENGSSYAASRAAAFGAHLIDANPNMSRDGMVNALDAIAPTSSYHVPSLTGKEAVARITTRIAIDRRPVRTAAIQATPDEPKQLAVLASLKSNQR